MKTLFIILKVITGITLITPTILSVTQNLEQNYNVKDTSKSLDQVVNTSTADQNSVLYNVLGGKALANENFDNFVNDKMPGESYPKDFTNDDSSRVTYGTDPSDGLAKDRYGGGLFFDVGSGKDGFNQTTKNKINQVYQNGLFGDSNFMSINHVMSPDKGLHGYDEADTITQQTLDANNIKGDIHPSNQRDPATGSQSGGAFDWQDIHQYFNKTIAPTELNDQIVNSDDFNYTPDYISNAKGQEKSTDKEAMRKLFDEELKDWYWNTWYTHFNDPDDPGFADVKHQDAQNQDKALEKSGLPDDVKLNLNFSWNQLVAAKKVGHENTWYSELAKDATLDALGGVLDMGIPGLGEVGDGILNALLPDDYTDYADKQKLYTYYSEAFNKAFWDSYFDKYLGTPDGKNRGLLQQYYKKYGEYPSDISMKNFDFYTPYKDININSTHRWKANNLKDKQNRYNYSTSNVDFSQPADPSSTPLAINLGVEFNMTRTDPTDLDLLNKLEKYGQSHTIHIGHTYCGKDKDGKYNADNDKSRRVIDQALNELGFANIVPKLTFSGILKQGKISSIEVKYNTHYKFNIPILMG